MKMNFTKFTLPVLALSLGLSTIDSEADAKSKTNATQKAPAPKAKTEKPKTNKAKSKTPPAKAHKAARPDKPSNTQTPPRSGSCDIAEVQTWKPVKAFINMQTGELVGDTSRAHERAFFSSASKIMITLMTLDRMKKGTGKDKIAEDERIPIQHRTYKSASKSKYIQGIDPIPASIDETTPDQILSSIFIRSSNDGPNALAMRISGNLQGFYSLQNNYARRLGMEGNWNSATGFNTAEAIKSHWETPFGMAKLMATAYNEFGGELKSFYGRSRELYGYKKGSDTKIKFTLKSKIEAFDTDYKHHIKELEIMKPGFTCFGGIAAGGVVKVEGINFAFAYAGYRSKEQRDADINETVVEIRAAVKSGKIKPVIENPPIQTFETVKSETTPQEASLSNAPAPADSNIPASMLLGFLIIPALAATGLVGDHFLNKGKLKQGFIKANKPSVNSNEPSNWLSMGGSPLLSRNPY